MNNKSFTLIELLVVIAIIGVLSAVVMTNMSNASAKARDSQRISEINQIKNVFEQYFYDDNFHYPIDDTGGWGFCMKDNEVFLASLSGYAPLIPEDPKGGDWPCYRYYSDSEGTGYILTCQLESSNSQMQGDGGELSDLYEVYDDIGFIGDYGEEGGGEGGGYGGGGLSCKDILDDGNSTGDGVYWIDPDGFGGEETFQVYCDMTTDSGGWTLVFTEIRDNMVTNLKDTDGSVPTSLTDNSSGISSAFQSMDYAHERYVCDDSGDYDSNSKYWTILKTDKLFTTNYESTVSITLINSQSVQINPTQNVMGITYLAWDLTIGGNGCANRIWGVYSIPGSCANCDHRAALSPASARFWIMVR